MNSNNPETHRMMDTEERGGGQGKISDRIHPLYNFNRVLYLVRQQLVELQTTAQAIGY